MNVLKYKKGAALAAAVVTAACVAALASAAGLLYYADCTGERVARALFAPAGNALAEAGGQDAGWDGAAEISFEGAYGAPVPATLFPPGEGAAGTSGSEGVLVVLLPEAGATRRSLYPLARSFAENAYEAVAVDLRGYGGQGDAAGGALSTFGYLESDDLRRCLDGLAGRGMGRNGLILYGQGVGAAAAALCAEGLGAELRALVVDGLFAEAAELSETAAGEFLSFAPARDGAAGILAAGPAGGAYSGFELLCAGRYMMDEYGYEAPAASPLAALAGVTAPTMIIHDPADGVVAPDSGERLYEASAAERKELVAAGIAHGGAQPAGGGLSSYMRAIYGFIGLHDDFVIADDEIDRDPSNPAMASGTPLFRGGDLLFEDGAFNQFYFDGGMADSFIGAVNEAYATLGDETRVHLLLAPMPCEFYVPEPYWSSFNASQEDALAYVRERLDDGVEMVDAYRLIKAHRDEYLYFRTDHHWSALGAYYAYRAFARSIGEVPQELAGL
ncbi:MAG: hypothetical protein LBS32_07375, partial [Clostridiales Family XIII bacterium]|nr:hypothetical protein [Clostridiales Family XIII bacterium]